MYLLRFQARAQGLLGHCPITSDPLGFTCQRLPVQIHLRLRLDVQHIYSHAQNLWNECADHAASLGTFGLVSYQNIRTRWTHLSFDSNSLFAPCDTFRMFTQCQNGTFACSTTSCQRLVFRLTPRLSLWFFSVTVSVLPFDRWFVTFDSVNADAPLQLYALFGTGGTRHFFHLCLLVLAHLSGLR